MRLPTRSTEPFAWNVQVLGLVPIFLIYLSKGVILRCKGRGKINAD